jgi:hypothetical protein
MSQLLADTVAKVFLRPKRAILIQDRAQAHNIDSKHYSIEFDYCPLATQQGVLQQYRHEADVTWAQRDVRFQGESGHDADWLSLPSLTHNGLGGTCSISSSARARIDGGMVRPR